MLDGKLTIWDGGSSSLQFIVKQDFGYRTYMACAASQLQLPLHASFPSVS
jgi:hypothetical protein